MLSFLFAFGGILAYLYAIKNLEALIAVAFFSWLISFLLACSKILNGPESGALHWITKGLIYITIGAIILAVATLVIAALIYGVIWLIALISGAWPIILGILLILIFTGLIFLLVNFIDEDTATGETSGLLIVGAILLVFAFLIRIGNVVGLLNLAPLLLIVSGILFLIYIILALLA